MDHETKSEDSHGLDKICCHGTATESPVKPENENNQPAKNENRFLGICIIIAAIIIGGTLIFTMRFEVADHQTLTAKALAELEKKVLPDKGVTLPVRWGDLGKQLTESGVIDQDKFEALYAQRGGLDEATNDLLTKTDNGRLIITKDNAGALLNMLWALGLANKNEILEKGPMMDKQYGGDASRFASTGGWTLAVDSPMNHYSHHAMIPLTPEQQLLVETVSKNIYRPCCGNSVYFPDCNHGLAMLGLLELMASQGASEQDIWKAALAVNSYWFPENYLTVARYLEAKGLSWDKTEPKALLGANFSSAAGYQQILKQIQPATDGKGSSCGV